MRAERASIQRHIPWVHRPASVTGFLNLTIGHMDTTLVAERGSTVRAHLMIAYVERHLNAPR